MPSTSTVIATALTTASPPRYGVAREWPLYPAGWSMKPVRRARRMATGTRSATAVIASRKLAATRSSSGNGHLSAGLGVCGLVRDDVVEGVVDRVERGPAGRHPQPRGVRAAMRDLFEA